MLKTLGFMTVFFIGLSCYVWAQPNPQVLVKENEIVQKQTEVVRQEDNIAKENKRQYKPVWKTAKDTIEKVLLVAGSRAQPVFIHFGAVGEEFINFHYQTSATKDVIKEININGASLGKPRPSSIVKKCPPFSPEVIDFDLVAKIFKDMAERTERGYKIDVNLARRHSSGCTDPEWQGIAQYMTTMLMVTYSLDGEPIDIKKYSF